MIDAKTSTGLKANFSIVPAGSQVLLVACLILAALLFIPAYFLFASGLQEGWIFIVIALVVLCFCFWGWNKSRVSADFTESLPTKIICPDGTEVITDSRTLLSLEAAQSLGHVFQRVISRKPLPEATAVLGSDMAIVPDTEAEAKQRVNEINESVQKETNQVLEAMNGFSQKRSTSKIEIDYEAVGPSESVKELNKPVK